MRVEFFRGLKIRGKIFSRQYELSRDSWESILGVAVCKFILLVFSGGDSLLFFIFIYLFYIFLYTFLNKYKKESNITSCSGYWHFSSFVWKA